MKKDYYGLGMLFIIIVFLLFLLPLTKEQHQVESNSSPKAQRIVSLSPQNTEILFALGAGDRVVGVTNYCDYPAEALTKEKIGNFIYIDLEKIIDLEPDLVIANQSLQQSSIAQIRKTGIPVLIVENNSLDDLLRSIDQIGLRIGLTENAQALRHQLMTKEANILSKIPAFAPSPRVFIEVWDHPLLTAGNQSHLNDLIQKAGGISISAKVDREYFPWDIEKLYTNDPDIYLRFRGTDMGSKADTLSPHLSELRAVKTGNVFTLFDNSFVRSGPRSLDALETLVDVFYTQRKE